MKINYFYIALRYIVKVKVKVKLSLCLTKHHAMKTYWGVEASLITNSFLAQAILNTVTQK